MPKFVVPVDAGHGSARLRDNPERLREVGAEVEAMGVKVLAQYALLGNWDFLNILDGARIERDDDEGPPPPSRPTAR